MNRFVTLKLTLIALIIFTTQTKENDTLVEKLKKNSSDLRYNLYYKEKEIHDTYICFRMSINNVK